MMRVVFALVVLFGVAFAPAPFPKRSRGERDEITLQAIQGTWRVVSMKHSRRDGNHTPHKWNITHIRIKADNWTFQENSNSNAGYRIAIGNASKPATLDFYNGAVNRNQRASGQGIIRRKGDVIEIVYVFSGQQRATSFEQPPDNQWLLTLQKQR